jgi:hypothetical protein
MTPKIRIARRQRNREVTGLGAPRQQHDRRFRRLQDAGLRRRHHAVPLDGVEVREHQRERLRFAMLALAKPADRLLVARIDHQVKPPSPLTATM